MDSLNDKCIFVGMTVKYHHHIRRDADGYRHSVRSSPRSAGTLASPSPGVFLFSLLHNWDKKYKFVNKAEEWETREPPESLELYFKSYFKLPPFENDCHLCSHRSSV